MPGGFWPPPRHSNSRPFRRRRSASLLMGRKNHSENDLPDHEMNQQQQSQHQQSQQQQHQTSSSIQQQLQQQPHTTLVLPDNVRTILIAGTPECWTLSTSPIPYSPTTTTTTTTSNNHCDASLMTLVSELSPTSNASCCGPTIDEEEPFNDDNDDDDETTSEAATTQPPPPSTTLHAQGSGSLNWLLKPNKQKQCTTTTSRNAKAQQPQSEEKEPNSMVVVYRSPTRATLPPQEAVQIWLTSVEAVLKSREMAALVHSTRDVVQVAAGIAVRTAFLPVTLPFYMACATKDFVGWTVHQALVQTTGAVLQLANNDGTTKSHPVVNDKTNESDSACNQEPAAKATRLSKNPWEGLLQLVPVVLETAGKIKDEIGATVIAIVTPPNYAVKQAHTRQLSVQEEKERLERLKLPVFPPPVEKIVVGQEEQPLSVAVPAVVAPTVVTKADFSKYLLRVEDLGVVAPNGKNASVLFIDLSAEYRDKLLLSKCLEQLAARAFALTTHHAPIIPPSAATVTPDIEWKTEGTTAKLLRKKMRQTNERWEETLRTEILMWSGNFRKHCGDRISQTYRQYPLFLARGVVDRKSPRDFLEMLWDNNRTCEYNYYCLGREDILPIDDRVLSSSRNVHTGTKVVRSETRVPFTGLSVTLLTMMHCRPLPGGPQEGYMIVSRSLLSGMAGSHTSQDDNNNSNNSVQKSKSEILWGVNVFRSIPGHPGQTDLTSLSQVASAMVPQFLSQRIGIMGVEDFFRNVRHPDPKMMATTVQV